MGQPITATFICTSLKTFQTPSNPPRALSIFSYNHNFNLNCFSLILAKSLSIQDIFNIFACKASIFSENCDNLSFNCYISLFSFSVLSKFWLSPLMLAIGNNPSDLSGTSAWKDRALCRISFLIIFLSFLSVLRSYACSFVLSSLSINYNLSDN